MSESKFAFIVHPVDRKHRRRVYQNIKRALNSGQATELDNEGTYYSTPFHALTIPFVFGQKKVICEVVLCPMLPQEMVADEPLAIKNILISIAIAKSLGAKLVGLGGFTSIVGNGGLEIAKKTDVPVTSGNTYTAVSVVEALVEASKHQNINLAKARLAIIGATGDIGSACSQSLAKLVQETILVARNDQRLTKLAESLKNNFNSIFIEKRIPDAIRNADIIVTITSSFTTIINPNDLKPGSVVCDVSYPANIAREITGLRPDLFVFEGGIATSRAFVSQIDPIGIFWSFNPLGGMHACFVETLILALENTFEPYSIGRGNITQEKMYKIAAVAQKYDFHPYFSWNNQKMIIS